MRASTQISAQDIARARKDLGFFAQLVGWPLEPWQAESVTLPVKMTCITAARQLGKSRTFALRACWQAFRKRRQRILVLSSTEKASLRILEAVREIASHPLLNASVDDDFKTRVTLDNGSRIESVTASQKAVRGATIDLLLIDEACWIADDLLGAAALPTTAARPDAKIILASAPWGDSGAFFEWMMAGLSGDDPDIAARQWALADAHWISPGYIAAMRRILPPLRFRAEVLGEWVGAGDAFFSREDILACVARYPLVRDGGGAPALMGLDWGRQRDRHAIAIVSVLQDYGVNGRPVAIVPWVETSKREYDAQFAEIGELAARWSLAIWSETNGPGGPATELLAKQVTRCPVRGAFSTLKDKEQAYQRLNLMLERREIVIPDDGELLRQMGGVSASLTPSGGMHIEARLESIHDDLPDALALAVSKLPAQLPEVAAMPVPCGVMWTETPAQVKIPVPFATLRPEASYGEINGALTTCGNCRGPYRAVLARCCHCQAPNPAHEPRPEPAPVPAAAVTATADVPAPNWWSQTMMQCGRDSEHKYDRQVHDSCPHCRPGVPFPGGGLPPGLASRLGPFLGPGR